MSRSDEEIRALLEKTRNKQVEIPPRPLTQKVSYEGDAGPDMGPPPRPPINGDFRAGWLDQDLLSLFDPLRPLIEELAAKGMQVNRGGGNVVWLSQAQYRWMLKRLDCLPSQ